MYEKERRLKALEQQQLQKEQEMRQPVKPSQKTYRLLKARRLSDSQSKDSQEERSTSIN